MLVSCTLDLFSFRGANITPCPILKNKIYHLLPAITLYSLLPFYCSKTHNFLVFLQRVLHRGYWSSRSQTEPSFQNQDRSPHEVLYRNDAYPNTSSSL